MAASAAAAAAPRNNASFVVNYSLLLLLVAALYLSSSSSSFAAAQQTVVPNVTQVLTEAGDFTTFLSVAGAANVTQALQSFISANNTAGATAFIPVDSAFTNDVVAAYGNLSAANRSLVLYYHVVPKFYNATEVITLSDVATLASSGNSSSAFRLRAVNQSSSSGIITVYGNLNSANVTNKTVNASTFPIAIHPIDAVLLPKEIFGGAPPPAPAPVPASDNNSTVTPPASAPTPTPAPTSDNNSTVTPPAAAPAPAPASNNNGTSKAPAPAPATNTTSKTTTTAPAPNGTAHTTLFLSLSLSLLLLSFHLIFFLA